MLDLMNKVFSYFLLNLFVFKLLIYLFIFHSVRSLASVSLRKSLKYRTPFHFDYFAISFGSDYSGLYGGVLKEETEYTAKCIQRILSLYRDKVKTIILIGHSMVSTSHSFKNTQLNLYVLMLKIYF